MSLYMWGSAQPGVWGHIMNSPLYCLFKEGFAGVHKVGKDGGLERLQEPDVAVWRRNICRLFVFLTILTHFCTDGFS